MIVLEDRRSLHALTEAERSEILTVVNHFSSLLREHGQQRHRGRARAPQASRAPNTQPNWSGAPRWPNRSRFGPPEQRPVLHGDNGASFKATTVLAMLHWLGIKPSYSRPRVSDDNAFVESLFRTAKYRPEFPGKGFADLEAARQWAATFVHWYNHDHRHSGIGYVSPAQRHAGQDVAILQARHALYQQARQAHPARWSGPTRNWTRIETVALNPEKDSVVTAATKTQIAA